MSTEIFISYRRQDAGGHARNLHEKLAAWFDRDRIFFDRESIESGTHFADVIERALDECAVLIALIAHDWASPELNSRRLNEPGDVVRREIVLAMSLGKKVIPVLIDGAPIPDAALLPEDLRPLLGLDVHTIGGKSADFDHGVRRLVELIARQPGVTPPRRRLPGADVVREGLPLLCDRFPQNEVVRDAIRAELAARRRRPIVLVVHGRTNEEHRRFVQRLEEHSVPLLLNRRPVRFVRLTEPLPAEGDAALFGRRLREAVCAKLQIDDVADDAALLAALRGLRCTALVIVATWLASEFAGDRAQALQRMADHFAAFPDLPEGLILGFVACLKYDAPASSGGFLRRLFGAADPDTALRAAVAASAARFGGDARLSWHVAHELPSVTFADLDRWKDEVREIDRSFDVTEARLRGIVGEGARPMEEVWPELERLVAPA